jgi:hypothetical protein
MSFLGQRERFLWPTDGTGGVRALFSRALSYCALTGRRKGKFHTLASGHGYRPLPSFVDLHKLRDLGAIFEQTVENRRL